MNNEIEYNLVKTVAEPSLEVGTELLELGLEELANNDAVTKLPVVGSIFAVGKTAIAVRDAIFVKNILEFLKGSSIIDPDKRAKWLEKLESEGFQIKVGEETLSVISRLNDRKKNEIAGKLFARYIADEIDFKRFLALCEKLDRLFSSDITGLKTGLPSHDDDKERFRAIGLYVVHYPGIARPEAIQFASNRELIPNDDCNLLIEVIRS